jgi:hypothetical protein
VAVVTLPFGGLSVLIAGDFHQFPPVGNINRALYSQFPNTSCSQLGKNIYEQFITVVTLHQQMRIVDPVWDQLLQRARVGECTSIDLDEIRHLLLSNDKYNRPDFSTPPWDDVILITPRNSVQSRWNIRAVIKHSISSSSMLYLCPAEDSAHGSLLSLSQRFSVARLTLKETEHLPTVLRLVQGMRVMVTRNLAVHVKLSNGSRGRISDIFLDPREPSITSNAVATGSTRLYYPPAMVIIQLDFCDMPTLPGLGPGQVPLVPVEYKFNIGANPSTRITRRQFPLAPAYAFTDFKSQGQTIDHVLVDIGKTSSFSLSPFNAYVALSRGRGRQTIRLLRDFDDLLFTRHPSESLRVEDERIVDLTRKTKDDYLKGVYDPLSQCADLLESELYACLFYENSLAIVA